jgi:S1-C subfamily serine protease
MRRAPIPGRIAAAAVLLLLAAGCARPPAGGDLGRTLVEVHVTRVDADRLMPWRNGAPGPGAGYAVAVGTNLLLTTEELVRNHTLVEIRLAGRGSRLPARVVLADPQSDLALLEPLDAGLAGRLRPLPAATAIRRGRRHELVQFGAGDHLQRGSGTITEIAPDYASAAAPGLLAFHVASALRAGTAGTPVLRDGALAGIVLHYNGARDVSVVLAPDVIAAFLAASRRTPYAGPPAGGFEFVALNDPVRRRYLGVPEDDRGVQILAVQAGGTADGFLQPEDVLLAWDGFAIDNQGFYRDPAYGRLPLRQLIAGRRTVGESVGVEFVRGGVRRRLTLRLRGRDDAAARIPENAVDAPDDYLIDGGLLFRELTGDYLRAHGPRWPLQTNARLAWEYLGRSGQPYAPGERVVLLAAVLPDPVNIGYQGLRDEIVTAVNGHAVTNLAQLARIVAAEGGVANVTLRGWDGVRLPLDTNRLVAANRRIQRVYRIPSLVRLAPPPENRP